MIIANVNVSSRSLKMRWLAISEHWAGPIIPTDVERFNAGNSATLRSRTAARQVTSVTRHHKKDDVTATDWRHTTVPAPFRCRHSLSKKEAWINAKLLGCWRRCLTSFSLTFFVSRSLGNVRRQPRRVVRRDVSLQLLRHFSAMTYRSPDRSSGRHLVPYYRETVGFQRPRSFDFQQYQNPLWHA